MSLGRLLGCTRVLSDPCTRWKWTKVGPGTRPLSSHRRARTSSSLGVRSQQLAWVLDGWPRAGWPRCAPCVATVLARSAARRARRHGVEAGGGRRHRRAVPAPGHGCTPAACVLPPRQTLHSTIAAGDIAGDRRSGVARTTPVRASDQPVMVRGRHPRCMIFLAVAPSVVAAGLGALPLSRLPGPPLRAGLRRRFLGACAGRRPTGLAVAGRALLSSYPVTDRRPSFTTSFHMRRTLAQRCRRSGSRGSGGSGSSTA